MIEKIGVIYQDTNSLGLLKGLKARLKCDAELIRAPAGTGTNKNIGKKGAKIAHAHFQRKKVTMIIRFTDSDGDRWQDVRREEQKTFEDTTGETLVCGVAVQNTELWLNLMQPYLSEKLKISQADLSASMDPTGLIKNALKNKPRRPDQNASDVVAELVKNAPAPAFKLLLENDSFRAFYNDCRSKALGDNCEVTNEL